MANPELARGSARDRGYDRRWERRRRRHLESEPFCRICRQPGNHVDHVIPHRDVRWLFDLEGNLQTLCASHHTKKTARERTIPIAMVYPLDLPEPPHARPTRLKCGPALEGSHIEDDDAELLEVYGDNTDLWARNASLRSALVMVTDVPLLLTIGAPRTAERAFWSHVLDCPAELVIPETEGGPKEWWADYNLDQRAEEAMARRQA